MAVTGCGLHSCQAAMITPAAAPGMSKDAMPQKHPHAQKKQGHKHCSGCRITAGCSALRELHRVSLWGNLRLLWTQAPGQAPHTLQQGEDLQFCLLGWRQHNVYGTGPSERNGVPPCTETAASVHTLLGAQHIRACRLHSSSVQIPGPKPSYR